MTEEIKTTIDRLISAILQFDADTKTGKPEALQSFVQEFTSSIDLFIDFMLQPENKTDEYCLNFKNEISNVYDELFIQGKLIGRLDNSNTKIINFLRKLGEENNKIAGILNKYDKGLLYIADIDDLIKEIPEGSLFKIFSADNIDMNDTTVIVSKLIAIKKNGNPLGQNIKKSVGGNPFKDFVSKYQGLKESQTKEPGYILKPAYLDLIYERFSTYIDEPLNKWKERFIYPCTSNIEPIKVVPKAVEGSNRLVLFGILSAIQTTTGNAFDFQKFVIERFGIRSYQKTKSLQEDKKKKSVYKDKKTYRETVEACNKILKKENY